LEQVKPALVVIDPLQGYLGPVDMHRANETRPLLSGLGKLAEEYNCAVIAIRHLSKTGGGKAIYRGLGSIDFTAAARSILLVGEKSSTGEKAMVHTKSSCAEKGVTQGFTITELDGFMWAGVSSCTAEDLLAIPEKDEKETETPALDEAVEFFLGILGNGEKVPCKEIREKWKEVGITDKTARRAREKLGIKFLYGKNGKPNCWYLPDEYLAHTKEHEQDTLGNDVAHTNTDGQDGQDTKTPIESAFGYVAHVAHAQSDGQDTLEYDDIAEGLF
jgi:hypothetical protein